MKLQFFTRIEVEYSPVPRPQVTKLSPLDPSPCISATERSPGSGRRVHSRLSTLNDDCGICWSVGHRSSPAAAEATVASNIKTDFITVLSAFCLANLSRVQQQSIRQSSSRRTCSSTARQDSEGLRRDSSLRENLRRHTSLRCRRIALTDYSSVPKEPASGPTPLRERPRCVPSRATANIQARSFREKT